MSHTLALLFILLCTISFSKTDDDDDDTEKSLFQRIENGEEPYRTGTSKLLRNVIEFYNNTVLVAEKVEDILRYEPYNPLTARMAQHNGRMENVINKLENYLEKMKDGHYDSAKEYETFMASINKDIKEMNEFSYKEQPELMEHSRMAKVNEEKEKIIALVEKIHEKCQEFDENIATLDLYEIKLRYPEGEREREGDDENLPEYFDITLLTELMRDYTKIESYESIVKKYMHIFKDSTKLSPSDIIVNNEVLQPALMQLNMLEFTVQADVNDNAKKLQQFVPIVNKIRQRITKLVPEIEEQHEKMGEEILVRGLSAFEVNQKMVDLIEEVKEARKEFSQEHDEL